MPPPAPLTPPPGNEPPPANEGFQLAVRAGYGLPLGSTTDASTADLSRFAGGHFAVAADIGVKIGEHVFLGGYLGAGFGSAGSGLDEVCRDSTLTCGQTSVHVGALIQYNFAPDAAVNPWLGYGIGYEHTTISVSGPGAEVSVAASGPEFARLMAGVDFRVSPAVGIGPYIDMTVGQYSNVAQSDSRGRDETTEITNTALHHWLTFGMRFVVFP